MNGIEKCESDDAPCAAAAAAACAQRDTPGSTRGENGDLTCTCTCTSSRTCHSTTTRTRIVHSPSLPPFPDLPSSTAGYLPYWQLLVAVTATGNTVSCILSTAASRKLYPRANGEYGVRMAWDGMRGAVRHWIQERLA